MRWVAIVAIAIELGGCSLTDEVFFNHTVDLAPGTGNMSDIKQRGVFTQERPDETGLRIPVTCAEPSPDAMSAVSASLAGKIQARDQGSAEVAASMSEAAAFVGLRTQSIQLMRDGYYRICEGYMNGALSREDFDMMTRRYQANMLGLLAIEQLTGVVKANAAVLGGSAGASVQVNVAALLEQKQKAQDKLTADQASADAAAKETPQVPEKIATAKQLVGDDKKQLEAINKAIEAAVNLSANAAAAGTIPGETYNGPNAQTVSAVSDAVRQIAMKVLDTDYSGQMCFESFRRHEISQSAVPSSAGPINGISDYCNRWFEQFIKTKQAYVERMNKCTALADDLRIAGKLKEAAEAWRVCTTISEPEGGPQLRADLGAGSLMSGTPDPKTAARLKELLAPRPN